MFLLFLRLISRVAAKILLETKLIEFICCVENVETLHELRAKKNYTLDHIAILVE